MEPLNLKFESQIFNRFWCFNEFCFTRVAEADSDLDLEILKTLSLASQLFEL